MVTLEPGTLLTIALLSGAIGFGGYSASCALHVWRTRNAHFSAGQPSHTGLAHRLARWSIVLLGLGFLCMALAAASRVIVEREGLLTGEGLFTLRGREGFEVDYITREEAPRAGTLLARFRSPEREAEIAVLVHRREALAAEKRITASRPLDPDPEITRRQQELSSEQRHLQFLLDQLIPPRDLAAREQSRDRFAREEQIIRLDGDLDRLKSELEQAVTRRRLSKEQLAMAEALYRRHFISKSECIEQIRMLEVLNVEIVKLQDRLKNVELEKAVIQQNQPKLKELTAAQVATLDREIAQVRERLAVIRPEEQTLEAQLAADLSRARLQRREQLQQLELQLRQCDDQLSGLNQTVAIHTPFAGRVVYRNPSPSAALADTPLVVLAPAEGLRLRVRHAASEARALEKAGTVILEVVGQDVQRRFPGHLVSWRKLDHDPDFVVGELACNPPAEAVCDLVSGKKVRARLLWFPPLYTLPLFDLGVTLSAIGSVGWLGTLLRLLRKRSWLMSVIWWSRLEGLFGWGRPKSAQCPSGEDSGPTSVGPTRQNRSSAPPESLHEPRSLPGTIKPSGQPLESAEVDGTTAGVPGGEARPSAISATCRDVAVREFGSLGAVHRLLGSQLREAIIRRHLDPDLLAAIEWALDRHHVRAAKSLSSGLGDEGLGDHLESLVNGPSLGPDQGDDVPEGPPPPEVLDRVMEILRVIAPECLLPQMNRLGPPTQVFSPTRRASATAEIGDAGVSLNRSSAETDSCGAFHSVTP